MAYILCPGPVIGRDGQIHHISAGVLARLYRVSLRDCKIYDPERPSTTVGWRATAEEDIELRPTRDGNYKLPGAQHETK